MLNSLNFLKIFSEAKEVWRDKLIEKSKIRFPSQIVEKKQETIIPNNDEFQLISHVKTHKLLDKEIQMARGRKPLRIKTECSNIIPTEQNRSRSSASHKIDDRPYTARENQKKIDLDLNNELMGSLLDEKDFNLKIWSNSPKNFLKKQREIQRRVHSGQNKKQYNEMNKNSCFSDLLFINTKKYCGSDFKGKIDKYKIYKRLKIDKIFPGQKIV